MKTRLLAIFLGVLALALTATARATLIFEIERVSDTIANVTATGMLDGLEPWVNKHIVSFADPFAVDPIDADNRDVFSSSTMQVGGMPLYFAYILGPDWGSAGGIPWIYVGTVSSGLVAGGSISGALEWVLPADLSFASVGSSGDVHWGFAMDGNPTGTWTMVSSAVPEPTTLALMGLGLVGLGLAHRRAK